MRVTRGSPSELTRVDHGAGTLVAQPPDARRFLAAALAWAAVLFVAARLPFVERQLLVPLTVIQAAIARGGLHAPPVPVAVTLECSGADILALCLAVILAYPASWRLRAAG